MLPYNVVLGSAPALETLIQYVYSGAWIAALLEASQVNLNTLDFENNYPV